MYVNALILNAKIEKVLKLFPTKCMYIICMYTVYNNVQHNTVNDILRVEQNIYTEHSEV